METYKYMALPCTRKTFHNPFFTQQVKKPRQNNHPISPTPPPLFKKITPARLMRLRFMHNLLQELQINKSKSLTSPVSTLNINRPPILFLKKT